MLEDSGLRNVRICGQCAVRGVLLVAPKLAPVTVQKVQRPEVIGRVLRMLNTYAKAARSSALGEVHGSAEFCFYDGRAEGIEVAIATIKREMASQGVPFLRRRGYAGRHSFGRTTTKAKTEEKMSDLVAQLRQLKDGRITFDEFYRRTRADWRRMAAKLHRAWSLPVAVSVEDVAQEMLAHAYSAVGKWDPNRGNPLHVHVVWSAHAETKKWLHTQRKSLRRSGATPSRFPVHLSGMRLDLDDELGPDGALDLLASSPAEQEENLLRREEVVERAFELEDPVLRTWVLSGGDELEAAREVYGDWQRRLERELGCLGDAREEVRRSVRREIRRRAKEERT